MQQDTAPGDAAVVLDEVTRFLRREHGVETVAALGFENAYALAMRREHAERLGVRRIGDLAPFAPRLTLGGDYEFFSRPEWEGVRRTYRLEFERLRTMDSSLMYQAATAGDVDVISAFSTDGRIAAFDLLVLDDDRGAIPPYDAVILTSPRFAEEQPEGMAALRGLADTIDAERMRAMNLAVDQQGRSPAAVARAFLEELEAISPQP